MTEQKSPPANNQSTKPKGSDTSGDWLEGRTLGKYKLVKRIGAGSFASIYEAVHVHLQVPFAIKILHPAFAGRDEIVKRFFREAQAASQLQHENVVFIADFDVAEGIGPYIVMEYLEGETLKAFLEHDKTPPLEEVGEISRQICQALTLAHRKGIIHRDLKPENVFLIRRDMGHLMVKILDFGIAHLAAARDSITGAKLMGTPVYMAPEQFRGQVNSESLDIYSFGVILYEMLVGQPPFQGQSVQRLGIEHLLLPAPELNDSFPQALRQLQARLLGKTPEERPESMEETWSLLAAALDPAGQHPHWHQTNLLPNKVVPLPTNDTVISRVPGVSSSQIKKPIIPQTESGNTSITPAPSSEEIEVSLNANSSEVLDELSLVVESTNVSVPPLPPASIGDDDPTTVYRVEPTMPSPSTPVESPLKEDEEATLKPLPGLEAPPDILELPPSLENKAPNEAASQPEIIEAASQLEVIEAASQLEVIEAASQLEVIEAENSVQRVVLDESESSLAGSLTVADLEEEALELSEELNLETHHVGEGLKSVDTDSTAPGTLHPPEFLAPDLLDALDDMGKTIPGRLSPPTLAPSRETTAPNTPEAMVTKPAPSALSDTSKLPPPPALTPEVIAHSTPSSSTMKEPPGPISGEKTAPHLPPPAAPEMLQASEPSINHSLPTSNTAPETSTVLLDSMQNERERTIPGTIHPPTFETGIPAAPPTMPATAPPTMPATAPPTMPATALPRPTSALQTTPPPPSSTRPVMSPQTSPNSEPISPNVALALPTTPPSSSTRPDILAPKESTGTQEESYSKLLQSWLRMSRREKRLLVIVWLGVLIAVGSFYFLITAEMPKTKVPPSSRRVQKKVNFRMSLVRHAPSRRSPKRFQQVVVMTVPSSATVYMNGEKAGKTPLRLPLQVGKTIRFRFRREGFEDGIMTHRVQKLKTGSDSVLFHLQRAPRTLP